MTEQEKIARRTASVRFRDRPRERQALEIFERYLEKENPEDPEKKMKPQQVLIEALIALKEKDAKPVEVVTPIEEELASFRQQVAEGLLHINLTLKGFESRIQQLVRNGTLTEEQATHVNGAINAQEITEAFERNAQANFKPGRRKG